MLPTIVNAVHWLVVAFIVIGWMLSTPIHLLCCLGCMCCWAKTGECPMNPGEPLGSFIGVPASWIWCGMFVCVGANLLSWG